MCKRFEKNRESFVKLVYELGKFTEDEITKEFFCRNTEEFIVDENATVREILELLEEIGTLKYDGKNFSVVPTNQRINFYHSPLLALV